MFALTSSGVTRRQAKQSCLHMQPTHLGTTRSPFGRGVRFQGDNWQARTKRNGKELSLGLYNTAEEAVSCDVQDEANSAKHRGRIQGCSPACWAVCHC